MVCRSRTKEICCRTHIIIVSVISSASRWTFVLRSRSSQKLFKFVLRIVETFFCGQNFDWLEYVRNVRTWCEIIVHIIYTDPVFFNFCNYIRIQSKRSTRLDNLNLDWRWLIEGPRIENQLESNIEKLFKTQA